MENFKGYIHRVVQQVGSDIAVARYLGFLDGSRVGLWRRGDGRPDELNCIKLARWMGDDPVNVLRIAGYTEMADLLVGVSMPAPVDLTVLRPQLVAMHATIGALLQTADRIWPTEFSVQP